MRYQAYLRQRYRALLGYVGSLMGIIGILTLTPLFLLPFYPAEVEHAVSFLSVGVPLVLLGYGAYRWLTPKENISLTIPEAMVVVVLAWGIAITASAIPFMGVMNLSLAQAIFESTSGWTGTGLSVVVPESTTHLLLFHRSITQLWGGAGFAIIAMSAIASPIGAGFSIAEGRTDQLAPHVRRSATIVFAIYFGYVAFGVLLLRIVGMGWFDAFNHAFTAIGTGGFSTKNASIAHFDSVWIEWAIILLMLLGSINFFIAYTAFRGKWRAALKSAELHLLVTFVLVGALLLGVITTSAQYDLEKAIRTAIFEVVASITSTGFATADYRHWNDFGLSLLALLMIVGGGVGSTSGGIKLLRVYILYKTVSWEVRKAFMPEHAINEPFIWQGERREILNDRQIRLVVAFLITFLVVFVMGCGMMMAHGFSLRETVFEVASTLGNAGLSIGITQPNLPETLLWTQSALMLLGRLEFFAVIVGVFKLVGDGVKLLKPARMG